MGFTDETGMLLAPLTRRTLAPKGNAPPLRHRARQRDKVSLAAALTLSPVRGHVALYYQSYPDAYVDNVIYAGFLRTLLWHVRGPLVLLHDGGGMHKGEPVRAVQADFPRLHVHPFPPYAPELKCAGIPVDGPEVPPAEQLRPEGCRADRACRVCRVGGCAS